MEEIKKQIFIHPTAQVDTDMIGNGTRIWQYSVVLNGSSIGSDCNINFSCFIEQGAKIGNNVTIKSGIYLWDGVECEDDVFLGPNVVFTNDIYPRSKQYKTPARTLIKKGASIGANSTILAGLTIGRYAMTGIGSVITKDIPDYALFYGNPARFKAWIDEQGQKLESLSESEYYSPSLNRRYYLTNGILKPSTEE